MDDPKLTQTEHIVYRRQSFEHGCLGCAHRKYERRTGKMICNAGQSGHPDRTYKDCELYKKKAITR